MASGRGSEVAAWLHLPGSPWPRFVLLCVWSITSLGQTGAGLSSHGIQWDPISLPAPFLAALPGPAPLSLQKCIFQRLEKLVLFW